MTHYIHINNLSIRKSFGPDHLKCADIKLIHKSNDKHAPSNCKPCSLISNIAQICKKIIYNRKLDLMMKGKILPKKEYGFMKQINQRFN